MSVLCSIGIHLDGDILRKKITLLCHYGKEQLKQEEHHCTEGTLYRGQTGDAARVYWWFIPWLECKSVQFKERSAVLQIKHHFPKNFFHSG